MINPIPTPISTDIKKVLILGAECTGKSTLSRDLAAYFNTCFVPEYLRCYLEQKPLGYVCQYDDLLPVAIGQIECENRAVMTANRYLFCDTSLFELMVYSHWYFNKAPPAITWHIKRHRYDVVLLTDNVGIAWVADGMRDLPNGHDKMRALFVAFLQQFNMPYIAISGEQAQRVAQVVNLLKQFKQLNINNST